MSVNDANRTAAVSFPPLPQPSFNHLYVYNLPLTSDKTMRNAVKLRLRRLSDNCGGRVLGVSQGTAVLRFGSPEAAARARKRMENEDVFGHRISLSFSLRPIDDASPEAEPHSQPHLLPQTPSQTSQTQDSVFGPPPPISSSSGFRPLEIPRSPRRPRRATRPCHTPGPVAERPYSPRRGCSGPPGGASAKPHQVSRLICACFPSTSIALSLCMGCFVNHCSFSSPPQWLIAPLTNSL